MKAIIEIKENADTVSDILATARKIDAGEKAPEADYHLNFTNAEVLFRELTPARLGLLEHLKALGPQSIYGLAKSLKRDYKNVHGDVTRLIELDLIVKDGDKIRIPWEAIQITLATGELAA